MKYVKYAWKPMCKIWSTMKAQERCEGDVVLVSLLSTSEVWVLRTQLNIYDRAFFAIQWTKAKILKWVLITPVKVWIDFILITWLWLGWVTWGFSASFMSTFIQIFQKLILKKNSNNLMPKTNRAYSRNRAAFYTGQKGHFFMKKEHFFQQKAPTSPYSIPFLKVLHQGFVRF